MNFKDTIYLCSLLCIIHPPYNITMLFIELSEGVCFAVGPGLLYLLLLLFDFFLL